VDRKFTWQFSSAEAAANARVLSRALYGHAGFIYAMLVTAASLAVLGVALAGSYLGWWGDYYIATVIVAAALVLLLSRFVAPWLRRTLFRPSHRGGEIEGRAVEYEFGDDGYRIRTETFEGFQKWAGVDRIIDTSGAILFVLGLNAHFLPDRLFASADARGEFLDWALNRISPEARARSGAGATPSHR
jgi:membrane protein implicated in regulation of membrane protease activity